MHVRLWLLNRTWVSAQQSWLCTWTEGRARSWPRGAFSGQLGNFLPLFTLVYSPDFFFFLCVCKTRSWQLLHLDPAYGTAGMSLTGTPLLVLFFCFLLLLRCVFVRPEHKEAFFGWVRGTGQPHNPADWPVHAGVFHSRVRHFVPPLNSGRSTASERESERLHSGARSHGFQWGGKMLEEGLEFRFQKPDIVDRRFLEPTFYDSQIRILSLFLSLNNNTASSLSAAFTVYVKPAW